MSDDLDRSDWLMVLMNTGAALVNIILVLIIALGVLPRLEEAMKAGERNSALIKENHKLLEKNQEEIRRFLKKE